AAAAVPPPSQVVMKIGFFGNQNNYPFQLARALHARGHDVRVLIDRPEPLNRPEGRYAISYPYPDWISETASVHLEDVVFRTARWRRVLDWLRQHDAVVLNSLGIAAAAEVDVPALCLATGSDLDLYGRPETADDFAWSEGQARPRDWIRYACSV